MIHQALREPIRLLFVNSSIKIALLCIMFCLHNKNCRALIIKLRIYSLKMDMDWQLIFISNCLWLFISRRGNVKDEMDIKQVDEKGDDDDVSLVQLFPQDIKRETNHLKGNKHLIIVSHMVICRAISAPQSKSWMNYILHHQATFTGTCTPSRISKTRWWRWCKRWYQRIFRTSFTTRISKARQISWTVTWVCPGIKQTQ